MRSIGLLVLALALVPAPTSAETRLGAIAGLNFSNLNIEGRNGLGVRKTFAAGGVVDLGINDRFGIRIEPMYLSKGATATQYNNFWATMDGAVFKLDYVDLPVLARLDLAASETRAYLLGGVGVSFATGLEAELSQSGQAETVDLGDVFSPLDVSLDLGAGISFLAGANRMGIDGRVAIGLMDINDGGTITFKGTPLPVPSTSTRTIDFRLFVTYLIPLHRQ